MAARLVDGTRGNPLALLEVAGRLTPAQRLGAAPLPDPLPVGMRLELVYEPLLAGLSAPAWRAVLLCAAGPRAPAPRWSAPCGARASTPSPPWTRPRSMGCWSATTAVWGSGTRCCGRRPGGWPPRPSAGRPTAPWPAPCPGGRPDGPELHLAEAAGGPDDALARELVAVAEEDRTRRGFAAASAALERRRPAHHRPRPGGRAAGRRRWRRLRGRDIERTRTLAARVLDGPAGRAARAQVLATLGVLEQYAGSVPRAAELLATAAELAEGPQRVWALAELGHTRFRLNDLALGEIADRLAEAADLGDPGQQALAEFMRGVALTVGGDPAAGRPLLAGVLELLRSPALGDDRGT